jgi:uncharacterized membrane protein YGL010W
MNVNLTLRDIGMGLVFSGLILLFVFGLYTIFASEVDLIIRISLLVIILGILIAIFSLLKENYEHKDHETVRKY